MAARLNGMTADVLVKSRRASVDRRNFGRRQTVWHAWIYVSGRPRMACLVRNISAGGALLECDVPVWMGHELRLVIEPYDIDVACDVRHKGLHGLGVQFQAMLDHPAVRSPDRPNTAALPQSTRPGASAVRRR